jgi:hypothetical protein
MSKTDQIDAHDVQPEFESELEIKVGPSEEDIEA